MLRMAMPQTSRMGPRSRNRVNWRPRTRRPATVNMVRLLTSRAAKKISSMIFANSPGWMENGPRLIHTFASELIDVGQTIGRAERNRPPRPSR